MFERAILTHQLVDREIWDGIGYKGSVHMAWVGIKHDGSTWTRVGDGQDAEMDPNGWYQDAVVPDGSSDKFSMIVLSSVLNSAKNMRLDDQTVGYNRFICEKEIV